MSEDVAQLQARLTSFYLTALEELRCSGGLQPEEMAVLSAPFLLNLQAAKAYFDAPTRIMFVGQETKGWLCRLPAVLENHALVDDLLARYATGLLANPGHSRFLQTRRYLEQQLAGGIPGAVIWNNLFKMDVYRGKKRSRNARRFSDTLTEFSAKLFRFEFELLRPDVVILGCSATHDAVIKEVFEQPKRKTVLVHVPRALWHFTYGHTDCFRTLHPAVGRFGRGQAVQGYYETIIEAVRARRASS
ncbi:MAG: hypothetical protein ACJ8LG_05945 [Massilia sp.]